MKVAPKKRMAVVGVIALIIIGPKDLPRILRYAGRWAGKARTVAREFRRNFDDMVRESELDEVKKSVEAVSSSNPVRDIGNSIDPTGELKQEIESVAQVAKDEMKTAKDETNIAADETTTAAAEETKDEPKSQASG